jgi:predicted RNA-binding protein YlxR (DUF448 family)
MARSRAAGEAGPAVPAKQHSGRGSPSRRHIPLRTCVACRTTGGKRELVRVVRTPTAGVQVDITGKLAGRGAYLCKDRSCWEQGLRSQRLNQALKTTLTSEEIAALWAFAATLPEMSIRGAEAAPSSDHT